MGATIAHGVIMEKRATPTDGGSLFVEILPIDGDCEFPPYSIVKAAVEYAHSLGVDPDIWPIYYGLADSEIEIEELYGRCQRLREALSVLSDEQLNGHYLLKRFATWLFAGERFFITE
jgi:hypothetical protein